MTALTVALSLSFIAMVYSAAKLIYHLMLVGEENPHRAVVLNWFLLFVMSAFALAYISEVIQR
jgi:hypothetical protein